MGIQNWSEDVILVDLPRELEEHHELQTVICARTNDTDLAEITVAWPELPGHIRAVIMTLVHTQGIKR